MTARSFRLQRQLHKFLRTGGDIDIDRLRNGMLRIFAIDADLKIFGTIIPQQDL